MYQLLFKGWGRVKKLIVLFVVFSISFQVFALVDYSEQAISSSHNQKLDSKMPMNKIENNGQGHSTFSLSTGYEMSEIKSEKVGSINFDLHAQTPYNVFFDGSFWQADYQGKTQAGNPKFILGFNWLKLGNASDEARLDLMAGMRFSGQSQIATSRTDKIFGIETTKRFMNFGLGLGYELTVAGAPKNLQEVAIGNIHRISVSSGWMVSNDIQFELEAENFRVLESSEVSRLNRVAAPISFSSLSPKLNLGISSFINFVLGARFQMQKASVDAKLFDLHGANSNSIFTGLNLSI
jgi:hypothetical protein